MALYQFRKCGNEISCLRQRLSLHIEPALFVRFPRMRVVVAVAHGIDNQRDRPELTTYWHTIWTHAASQAHGYGNAQSHPHVHAFREQFRAMGVSSKKFPSAIEALLRRALKAEVPGDIEEEIAEAVQTALQTGLQTYFEVPATTFILDEHHHCTADW